MARKFKTEEDKTSWEANAKQELIAVEQQAFQTQAFYKLTPKVAVDAVDASLSTTAYRLWIYLSSLYQFGDRFEYIPTQSELAARLGVSRQSILRAAADLEEAKLWEFRVERWKGKNLTGHGFDDGGSQKSDRGTKNVTPCSTDDTGGTKNVTPCIKNEQLHNIDRACAKTYSDLDQTLSEKSELENQKTFCNLEEKLEETKLQSLSTLKVESKTRQTNLVISSRNGLAVARRNDPFYNRRIDPKDIEWDWVPEGPWKTEQGKLDTVFQTSVAQRWVKEHGGDLHEKKANVLKHFKKDPANLPIEWEWYQSLTLHKAANIQTRKLAGIDTTDEEQEILKHKRASAELPQEMRVTQERLPFKALRYAQSPDEVLQQVSPHTLTAISHEPHLFRSQEAPKDEFGEINPLAYQENVNAENSAYWQNIYLRCSASIGQQLTDGTELDELSQAKALVESLTTKQVQRNSKALTSIAHVFSPQEVYATTLDDMRKYLNSGSDSCRQVALGWASDPKNGCELVKVNGRVVDIRELEF